MLGEARAGGGEDLGVVSGNLVIGERVIGAGLVVCARHRVCAVSGRLKVCASGDVSSAE